MAKPKFKLIKRNDNPYEVVIESTVTDKKWVSTFTLNDIERHIANLNKVKTELESRKKIEEAKIQNVKIQHPEIDLNIDKKIRIAYAVVEQANAFIQESEKKIGEIDNQLKQYAEDITEIQKQTGLELPQENAEGN